MDILALKQLVIGRLQDVESLGTQTDLVDFQGLGENLFMFSIAYFIGCPFKDGARGTEMDPITKKPFYDCYGLFMAIYEHIYGIILPDVLVSCFDTIEINRLYNIRKSDWHKIEAPQEPCAVAIRFDVKNPRYVNHFGVYVGNGRFIHTTAKTGSIISSIYDRFYSRHIEGFYKYGE